MLKAFNYLCSIRVKSRVTLSINPAFKSALSSPNHSIILVLVSIVIALSIQLCIIIKHPLCANYNVYGCDSLVQMLCLLSFHVTWGFCVGEIIRLVVCLVLDLFRLLYAYNWKMSNHLCYHLVALLKNTFTLTYEKCVTNDDAVLSGTCTVALLYT